MPIPSNSIEKSINEQSNFFCDIANQSQVLTILLKSIKWNLSVSKHGGTDLFVFPWPMQTSYFDKHLNVFYSVKMVPLRFTGYLNGRYRLLKLLTW